MIWIIVLASLVVLGAATYFVISNPSVLDNSSGNQSSDQDSKENEENNDIEPKEQSDIDSSISENSQQKGDKSSEVVDDNGYIVGQPDATEPTYVEGVLVANKKYPLPKTFQPGEDVDARAAFELMAADARKAGFELVAFSTYRSYEYQQTLYNNYVERDGKENADRYSARPGYSEHQTGLAFDVGEVDREDLWLTSEFGETEAGKWLVNNAHKYGFILRYPQGKEKITGYMYESWHFRYLGIQLATEVKKSNLTLEEYLGIQ
ncbi:D-alanyl-D-alanine carboxypeptidase family protein [Ureibacillus sp. NPDC094379]